MVIPSFLSGGNCFVGIEVIAVSECEVKIPNVIEFHFPTFPFDEEKTFEKVRVNVLWEFLNYVIAYK